MQIVWFKRDLRVYDNEALKRASCEGPIIPIYIFEEDLWKLSIMSFKHYTFLRQSLRDLNKDLERLGQNLIIEKGNCIDIFKKYKAEYHITKVWSHEETWNLWVKKRNILLSD